MQSKIKTGYLRELISVIDGLDCHNHSRKKLIVLPIYNDNDNRYHPVTV